MESHEIGTNYPASTQSTDESTQLNRNRSFKCKQLVRSAAIRESHSPPRSPSSVPPSPPAADLPPPPPPPPPLSQDVRKHTVEIQITHGGWDVEPSTAAAAAACQPDSHTCSQLLSNNPRVECVCVCDQCPVRRGRRRKQASKQDSGISDECPDCSDTEASGGSNGDSIRKSASLELDTGDTQEYCRCTERSDKPKNIQLSRTDSDDKSDLTGVELVNFIKATLNKNSRDRATLLKIEKELHALINDSSRWSARFPALSSYGRLLVHRAAAWHALAHRLDPDSRAAVLVTKTGTCGGRIPCTSFKEWCNDSFTQIVTSSTQQNLNLNTSEEVPHSENCEISNQNIDESILKRAAHSLEAGGERRAGGAAGRSKSLEQRERDYLRVRHRIFSTENCTQEDGQWPWVSSAPVKLLTPDTGRNKLLKVQSLETAATPRWWRSRPGAVSKSHSFGGCGEPPPQPPPPPPPRLLSRQGDLASSSWRLSPSSSGYKTLSLRSTDSVTPSPTGGVSPEPGSSPLLWAFTELAHVPRGALIIHPQSGQPLTNPDGSVYRYDPENPPALYHGGPAQDEQAKETRRGRLEKQNSFIDNDCEYRSTEVRISKNTCGCNLDAVCANGECDKSELQRVSQSPQSPEVHCDAAAAVTIEPTNRVPAYEPPTNQRTSCEPVTDTSEYVQSYVPSTENEQPPPSPSPPRVTSHGHVTSHPHTHRAHGHNTNAMPLPSVLYQTSAPQSGYYATQCRMEPQMHHPMYQQMAPPVVEEIKMAPQEEPTFRIDASYPYQPLEPYVNYSPQCAPCIDPTAMQHRGYGVAYAQPMEPAVMPSYPISNVLLSQPYPAQYQHLQWPLQPMVPPGGGVPSNCATPHQKPTSPPNIYIHPDQYIYTPQMYPMVQYPYYQNYVPQMVPQYCQPVYSLIDRPASNKEEIQQQDTVPYAKKFVKQTSYQDMPKRNLSRTNSVKSDVQLSRQDSNELAVKINQIKTQMASLTTDQKDEKVEDRRRNNGSGILGSYHGNVAGHNRVMSRSINDESQLSSAARAIVNSIRNMQAKTTHYNHHEAHRYQPRDQTYQKHENYQNGRNYQPHRYPMEQEGEEKGRRGPIQPVYRPPYLYRQMSPGTFCRRSPGEMPPNTNNPRRPPPDPRNTRRQ